MSKGIVDQINKKKCGTGQHLNLFIFFNCTFGLWFPFEFKPSNNFNTKDIKLEELNLLYVSKLIFKV